MWYREIVIAGLHKRTAEWQDIIERTEGQFRGISERHESFVTLVSDTNNIQTRQRIRTDSTLQIQVAQLELGYASLLFKHIYNLKMLRAWLADSKGWIDRIGNTDLSPQFLRRSWDAKQAHFIRLKEKADESANAFEALSPNYQAIRDRILP
jgi:hypothetical protein